MSPRRALRAARALALGLALAAPAAPAGAATVREPAYGLPHLFADTDVELARENGREIAKDRLAQLILLARAGRGSLYQAFGSLDPGIVDDDVVARRTGYTSSELNRMYDRLPQRERDVLWAYCEGVNDTIEAVFAGTSPEPLEVGILRSFGLGADLFGNATDVSDGLDPHYRAPGGADPGRPFGGFQFTPEVAMAIAVLEVRNFGFQSFDEDRRLAELQALVAKHGSADGTAIWRDLNFLNDPLAPVSVPDPATPGYGGPLAQAAPAAAGPAADASAVAARAEATAPLAVAAHATRLPRRDWAAASASRAEAAARRAERAAALGAWPKLGSYAWLIAASRSATGNPWLGGFPQTGIQTPSIMHFVENRSGEGIRGLGMEFAGGPFVLIGQTDSVAYTTTTAQLRVVDTFFETVVSESADALRYLDEGTPAPLGQRTELLKAANPTKDVRRVFWRSHLRGGGLGTRPVLDFLGDADGTAEGGGAATLVDDDASFAPGLAGGHVALVDGTGAGQIRAIASASGSELGVAPAWTTPPAEDSVYVAALPGAAITAVAVDSTVWMEESTAALGFSLLQRAEDALDVRAAVRLIPSTHNFFAADNRPWNGIGTDAGRGNISYHSTGFARARGGLDPLLPLDGSGPNPLNVVEGTVASAGAATLRAPGAFAGLDLRPPPPNYRYQFPALRGSEYVVSITSGTGFKQTRRIAANDADALQLEAAWGVIPAPGDGFEVQEIVAMPEAINPAEGYIANWNNKAGTADEGLNFGRNHRVAFITERLAADDSWTREEQRQLNADVAGLDSKGKFGRYLVPRLRQAVDAVGNGGVPEVDAVLAALEAHAGAPAFGRAFVDPVKDTQTYGELAFLESLVPKLAQEIFGDELAGAVSVPGGSRGLALVLHAIDHAAGDVPGSYAQEFGGDYFGGTGWETVVRDALAELAPGGIPAKGARPVSRYRHPLAAAFPVLEFPPTPAGNRGIWEMIVEAGPVVQGEFIFPLGQSGLVVSDGGAPTPDPHTTTLHPIWRDWRFLPMLHVSADLEQAGTGDVDRDGVLDGWERWYFGDTKERPGRDRDGDRASLLEEFLAGLDPTDADTDDDGILDGLDGLAGFEPGGQDRLRSAFLDVDGRFALPGGGRDRLRLAGRFGSGAAAFDPAANDLAITLFDAGAVLFDVTLPAGTLASKDGRTFRYRDRSGSLGGVAEVVLRLGRDPRKPAKLKLETVAQDFSAVGLAAREVFLEVALGGHLVEDARTWEPKRKSLVSGR